MNTILHFGPGNFFRAHLADYTHDAGGWDIIAVSLRSADFKRSYDPSRGFTLAVQGQKARTLHVIRDVLVAPEDPKAVLDAIADPAVSIVSATVTEKGYFLTPGGALDLDAPEIVDELKQGTPKTLIGYLAHGLAQRTQPITVLSCDNRMGNGDALEIAARQFCDAAGLRWSCDARFPNAMVDRITPATTSDLVAKHSDPLVVPCEPFKEWVIEDDFAGPRPDWPNVLFVQDVRPHEMRKLRMLNGAHSYLAYVGLLKGHAFVHEAVADPQLRSGVLDLMQSAASTLPPSAKDSAEGYAAALIERFANPHINHSLKQIAQDGSQKLPYRLVAPLRDTKPGSGTAIAAGINAWAEFCLRETRAGRELQDPDAVGISAAGSKDALLAIIDASDLTDRIFGDG